jgi:hypothetical protein
MTAVAKQDTRDVARPLKVLEKLILKDIEQGDEIAEQAGMEFYRLAGAKLVEAKGGHFEGRTTEFYEWADKTFRKTRGRIRAWMAASGQSNTKSFKSLRETESPARKPGASVYREWTAPVDAIAERAQREALRLGEELTRKQERDAEAKLGLKLIDIGYRVLAKELHPDKGGSREAMARLGRVRDRLRSNV